MSDERPPQVTPTGQDQDEQTSQDRDTSSTRNKREWTGTASSLERRSVLKLAGASMIPLIAGSATAAKSGYGQGGYGAGGYGGGSSGNTSDGSGVTDETKLENTILINGFSTKSHYEFRVSGSVEKSVYRGASINDSDVIDGSHVVGSIGGWRDAYRFSGELKELSIDGHAQVYVNGNQIDPADYGGKSSQVLTIVGNGVPSRYEITVSDSIKVIEGDGATVVSTGKATGSIEHDVHRLEFNGELVDVSFLEGGTQVYLDTDQIDPDNYDAALANLPHAIVIDGTDSVGESHYSFTVDGDVRKSTLQNATIDDGDSIDGSTVRGDVAAGSVDAYWFGGEITDFRLRGDATVDVKHYARR